MTPNFTNEEILWIQRRIKQWMEICDENGRSYGPSDATHSSLLVRLLSGKPALENPPPVRFSYPDYSLSEYKAVEVSEVDLEHLIIDQCIDWEWHDKENFILKHTISGWLYKYSWALINAKRLDNSEYIRKVHFLIRL